MPLPADPAQWPWPTDNLRPGSANRFAWDYARRAADLPHLSTPIVDIHTHINGADASRIYARVADLFAIRLTYSMTVLPNAQAVADALGSRIRFIAIHDWTDPDRTRRWREGYLESLPVFAERFGSRMMKIWAAPQVRDLDPTGEHDLWAIDAPWRVRACELAQSLGMMFMVHVADPDTWFATRYADTAKYPPKIDHYTALRRMLDRFTSPWIAAHMGGWPEDLAFLDSLLTAHPNLHLDTSATKWVIRELGKHPRDEVVAFLWKWKGRVLFGSDIVTMNDHLQPSKTSTSVMADRADSPETAFDLYASRYFALRAMFETDADAESPIADPDLAMVDPVRFNATSAPRLRGLSLPKDLLEEIYFRAADRVVDAWWRAH